jgi:glycosyltransferase involved in cell wall biosynthesis
LRGYDVVQLINPVHFIELKAERGVRIYDYLRRHNKKVFLGAFGYDYHYVYDSVVRRTLRYCDFYTPNKELENERNRQAVHEWLHTDKRNVCVHVANTCDGIISVLYEYDVAYREDFPDKTCYVPLPIALEETKVNNNADFSLNPIRLFVGMDYRRDELKGTDILYRVAKRVEAKYPNKCKVVVTESLPYDDYIKRMSRCDVLLDQIYSYTPGMNALQAMSMGLVVISGGEEEHYELIGEKELRPIINVQPNEEDVYNQLEQLILHPERVSKLKREGIEYVRRHHDSVKVTKRYLEIWSK